MKTLHAFPIAPMRATIPAHLTRLHLVIIITPARRAVTAEGLKLENPGLPGYDVETSGTTHCTTQCPSPKDPISQTERGKRLTFQF